MDSRHLDPSSAMVALTKQKAEAMRLAREQGAAVMEMCRRAKTEMPPYQFEELIGKGAYGRVYKGLVPTLPNLGHFSFALVYLLFFLTSDFFF